MIRLISIGVTMYDQIRRLRIGIVIPIFTLLLPISFAMEESHQEGVSAVAGHMKAINKSFRELRRHLDEPDRAEANLALIETMKKRLLDAGTERPLKTSDLAESEQASFLGAYQKMLDEAVATLGKLETAVKEKKWEEANLLVQQLNKTKKAGHDKFQKE